MAFKLNASEALGILGGGLGVIATMNPIIGIAGAAGGALIGYVYTKVSTPKAATQLPPATPTAGLPAPTTAGTTLGNPSHNVPIWSDIPTADVSGVAIPANYQANSPQTSSIQTALNSWAMAVNYPPLVANPLPVTGDYDTTTQNAVAQFQMYENSANSAGLTIDGLAGGATQPWLGDFGPITPGSY